MKSELQYPFEKWKSINIIIKDPTKPEVGPGEGHGDNSVGMWELRGRTWVPKQGFTVFYQEAGLWDLEASISPTPPVGSACSDVLMAVATSRLTQYICPNAAYFFLLLLENKKHIL